MLHVMNIDADDAQPFGTEDGDIRAQIAGLEIRLEELADAMARCRKIKLISQIAITGGVGWVVAVTIGAIGLNPMAMVAAISGVIGGTVVYGSNTTTWREVAAAMKDAEARRAALIGKLELRVVGKF
jgi:hypothetical protein